MCEECPKLTLRRVLDYTPLVVAFGYVLFRFGIAPFVGFLVLMLTHELGHAMEASRLGLLWRFDVRTGTPGVVVRSEGGEVPVSMHLSGGIVNVIFLPVLVPLLDRDVLGCLVIIVGISIADLVGAVRVIVDGRKGGGRNGD